MSLTSLLARLLPTPNQAPLAPSEPDAALKEAASPFGALLASARSERGTPILDQVDGEGADQLEDALRAGVGWALRPIQESARPVSAGPTQSLRQELAGGDPDQPISPDQIADETEVDETGASPRAGSRGDAGHAHESSRKQTTSGTPQFATSEPQALAVEPPASNASPPDSAPLRPAGVSAYAEASARPAPTAAAPAPLPASSSAQSEAAAVAPVSSSREPAEASHSTGEHTPEALRMGSGIPAAPASLGLSPAESTSVLHASPSAETVHEFRSTRASAATPLGATPSLLVSPLPKDSAPVLLGVEPQADQSVSATSESRADRLPPERSRVAETNRPSALRATDGSVPTLGTAEPLGEPTRPALRALHATAPDVSRSVASEIVQPVGQTGDPTRETAMSRSESVARVKAATRDATSRAEVSELTTSTGDASVSAVRSAGETSVSSPIPEAFGASSRSKNPVAKQSSATPLSLATRHLSDSSTPARPPLAGADAQAQEAPQLVAEGVNTSTISRSQLRPEFRTYVRQNAQPSTSAYAAPTNPQTAAPSRPEAAPQIDASAVRKEVTAPTAPRLATEAEQPVSRHTGDSARPAGASPEPEVSAPAPARSGSRAASAAGRSAPEQADTSPTRQPAPPDTHHVAPGRQTAESLTDGGPSTPRISTPPSTGAVSAFGDDSLAGRPSLEQEVKAGTHAQPTHQATDAAMEPEPVARRLSLSQAEAETVAPAATEDRSAPASAEVPTSPPDRDDQSYAVPPSSTQRSEEKTVWRVSEQPAVATQTSDDVAPDGAPQSPGGAADPDAGGDDQPRQHDRTPERHAGRASSDTSEATPLRDEVRDERAERSPEGTAQRAAVSDRAAQSSVAAAPSTSPHGLPDTPNTLNSAASTDPFEALPGDDWNEIEAATDEQIDLRLGAEPGTARADTRSAQSASKTRSTSLSARWAPVVAEVRASLSSGREGWQQMQIELEGGGGSVTVRARREAERVVVAVGFTDPSVRAQAMASAERLHESLQAEFGSNVDFSFDAQSDSRGDTADRSHPTTPTSRSQSDTRPPASSAPTVARPTLGAHASREWVG